MRFCVDLNSDSSFPHGNFGRVRVLKSIPGQSIVDVSKRSSRIERNLDKDEAPHVKDMVNGYAVHEWMLCSIRSPSSGTSDSERMCDGFLPDYREMSLLNDAALRKMMKSEL
jgi:hypothetical protein